MRMVDRVHSHSSNVGPPPLPPLSARFPDRNVLVIGIADLPDRRLTGGQDLTHLAGLETELNIEPFPSHHLRLDPRLVALEVDASVEPLVPTTMVPDRETALVVASPCAFDVLQQAFLGLDWAQLIGGQHRHLPAARGGRPKGFNTHARAPRRS